MILQAHKYSKLIPEQTEEEYSRLKKDIQKNGLLDPITLFGDQILDGRHRYKACNELEITPVFIECNIDPLSFVLSKIKHRNLTSSQHAAIAIEASEIVEELETEARERMESGKSQDPREQIPQGKVAEKLAKIFNTNDRYIKDAKIIKREEPETFEEIKRGAISITKAKREMGQKKRAEDLKNNPPIIPRGECNVIYADPPWQYDFCVDSADKIENKYPTTPTEELKELQIPASNNSVLYMWATAPKLKEALELMEAWGFEYKSSAIWDKETIGMGYWFRGQHEILLVGTKGQFSPPPVEQRVSSVYREKKGKHSKKPEHYYDLIESFFPNQKYLELFARNTRKGWTSFGNETTKND